MAVGFLLDTNVISEIRKPRPDRHVRRWFREVPGVDLYLSVLVVGEIRQGVERRRRHDTEAALVLDRWLRDLGRSFADRLLPVSAEVADRWGRLNVPDPVPTVDGLLAATALVHDLVLVTRNVVDVARTGVVVLDPFAG